MQSCSTYTKKKPTTTTTTWTATKRTNASTTVEMIGLERRKDDKFRRSVFYVYWLKVQFFVIPSVLCCVAPLQHTQRSKVCKWDACNRTKWFHPLLFLLLFVIIVTIVVVYTLFSSFSALKSHYKFFFPSQIPSYRRPNKLAKCQMNTRR